MTNTPHPQPLSPEYRGEGSKKGTWETVTVGGHHCEVYQPPRRNEHGFVLIYLHGVHLSPLRDQPPFVAQFDTWKLLNEPLELR